MPTVYHVLIELFFGGAFAFALWVIIRAIGEARS